MRLLRRTSTSRELAIGVARSLPHDEVDVDREYAEQTSRKGATSYAPFARTERLRPVMTVGDGINGAPALADIDVATGAKGATVSSETADVVATRSSVSPTYVAIERCTVEAARDGAASGERWGASRYPPTGRPPVFPRRRFGGLRMPDRLRGTTMTA